MDIIQQYEKQFPEMNKPTPQWQPSREYGFLIRFVMRLSGGKIRDEAKALSILLIVAVLGFAVSIGIVVYSFSGGSLPPNLGLHVDQRQFLNQR